MTIQLSPQIEEIVRDAVLSGEYRSAEEVSAERALLVLAGPQPTTPPMKSARQPSGASELRPNPPSLVGGHYARGSPR